MKSLKFTLSAVATCLLLLVFACSLSAQMQFEGLYSEGEGGAAWDADGSGPEPYGNGHSDVYYYTASRDYVDPTYSSGAHMIDIMNGFPCFEQALLNYGFTSEQVTMKIALASLGEDLVGIDWFNIGNMHYSNFYPIKCIFELNGEPLVEARGDYAVYMSGQGTRGFESGYLKVCNISGFSNDSVRSVAAAFMSDMGSEELKFEMEVTDAAPLSGNGRSGGYFDVSAEITKGIPTFPVQGLFADNEGTAGWDANGTGPEPYGNGHGNLVYYGASVDYDGINPSPDACLAHVLNGSDGFLNTLLQLQYRGYEIGDLKLKLGLCSLGPDVQGEDWGFESGVEWLNEYNNNFTFLINDEPIVEVLLDTNTMRFISPASMTWSNTTSVGKVYDVSANSSAEAQALAKSFLKDVGSHYLVSIISELRYAGSFSGNGRSGVYYEIVAGKLVGLHDKATFIPEGTLSGAWTTANSPYFIDGHQNIENGQTLTIEPGVEVKVRGPYHFNVQGAVIAEGTEDQNILFTRSNPNLWWDGFDYDETPVENQSSVFDHCIFEYSYGQGVGTGYNCGGAIAIKGFDSLTVSNSVFRHNKADIPGYYPPSGGAIALEQSDITIQKCEFYDNYSKYGGAIFVYNQTNPVISNNLFYQNTSDHGGAICYFKLCGGTLINNTITENVSEQGGAIYFYWHSDPEIINNIIWGNTAEEGSQIYITTPLPSSPGFFYNDIEGGKEEFHGGATTDYLFNLDANPLFMGQDPNPYALANETPCWNAGTPDTSAWYYPQYLPATCLCGSQRCADGCIDIGAYELLITGVFTNSKRKNDITLFPNPFKDNLHIGFSLTEKAAVSLSIYNTVGVKVAETDFGILQAGDFEKILHFPDLNEGIYFIRVRINDRLLTEKVVRIK